MNKLREMKNNSSLGFKPKFKVFDKACSEQNPLEMLENRICVHLFKN